MKYRIKLSLALIFFISHIFSQVIISEVMYSPTNSNAEFIELYNSSTTAVDLTGWEITDNNSTDDLVDRGDGLILAPNSYAVIVESDYSGIYDSIIPSTAIVIEVDDKSIGNGLSAIDSIKLKDPTVIIDLVKWTDIAPDNHSIEKIRLDLPNTTDNWSASKDSLGTPGSANSVTPKQIDGAIDGEITYTPAYPDRDDNVVAIVPLLNAGLNDISGTLTATVNGSNIGTKSVATLTANESKDYYLSLASLPSGRHNVTFEFEVAADGDLTNNTATKKLGISYKPGTIQINEFLAEPGDNQIEFIELVVSRSVVIDGWTISDKSTSRQLPITYLEDGKYVVLASDTSLKPQTNPDAKYLIPYGGLPTLNNSGDNLYLKDMNHTIIDSLVYGSGWPMATASSTEKLHPFIISNDPLNWKTSVDPIGITPGYINSHYLIDYDGEIIAGSIASIPQYPKNNEPVQLSVPITNHGAEPISGSLNIYNDNNSIISTTDFVNIARRDTTTLTFDLPAMSSGIHPLQFSLEVVDDGNLDNNIVLDSIFVSYDFGTVLINEFLAGPNSTQAEFVELISFENIDLINWSIEDATNNRKYFNGDEINSDTYIVLSEDLSFNAIIPADAHFVEVEDFPSLNNYGDAIYLRDFTGTVIDSLIYTTWWELETGKSTEKIYPDLISNDSTAWKISMDSTGMTPGKANSVIVKNVDGAVLGDLIYNNPQYPEPHQSCQLNVPVANPGLQSMSGEILIEYKNAIIASTPVNSLAVGDTSYYSLTIPPMPSGIHNIDILFNIDNDENINNNLAVHSLKISYEFGTVKINEFLADPEAPQYEFVELFTLQDIDLNKWSIADNRGERAYFGNEPVAKNNYIIVSEEPLSVTLPENTLYFEIPNFPSLNNSGDAVYLYDYTGKIIDSLVYNNADWPIESGSSAEKVFPAYNSNDASNWRPSTAPSGSTMGSQNSVLLNNIDGKIIIELVTHYPEHPHPRESIAFEIGVQNTGIEIIDGEIYIYYNGAELGSDTFIDLMPADTTYISFNIEPLNSGNNELEIVLEIAGDMQTGDNQMTYEIFVSYPFGVAVLNEFLAKPDSTQAEFVEIVALSDIDLIGWSISDNTYKQHFFDDYYAFANAPIVITTDTSFVGRLDCGASTTYTLNGWPTLNNESDGIFLYDPTGAVVDSLIYDSDWPILEARSTEKYRPDFESDDLNRWGIAVNTDGMTPGYKNSLYFDELPDKGTIEFEANPFSPNNDGIDDELLIKYRMPYEQGIIKLQIFDMTGREIATPYWNVYFPQEGILRWDGTRDNGDPARIGIYIVKLSVKDANSNRTWEKVKTVVLAQQL